MAEIVKTVRIETGNGERSVKSLKKEISDLRDALLNMDKGGEEWVNTAKQLTEAQEELNTVMKAGKQAVDADAESIAGMEARYKSLYATYRLLSQEQRKSAEGISMQKELSELSKNLNSVKKDAGNFKDNIGHYADDMMSAFGQLGISVGNLQGPFKLASLGAGGFKKALDTLAKHPILLTLTALIGLFTKVGQAIKSNEELQMRMNKVTAAFKPIGDAMALALDKVAGVAVKVAEGVAKVVTWMTNLFGLTKGLSDAELTLADRENALIKQRREYNELNSNDEARIQELLEEASLIEDKIEKEKLLMEAKELQEQVNQRNIELAEEELSIIKDKNAITPSSVEDLNKESEAQVKVNQARANGERAIRRINELLKSTQNTSKETADEAKKQLDGILNRLEDNSKTEIQKLKEKYEEEKALLVKYHKDTTKLEEECQRNIAEIEAKARVDWVNNTRETNQAIVDSFIIPSSNYYIELINQANTELETFKKKILETVGGTFENGFFDTNSFKAFDENGKLTIAAKELSDAFSLGLQDGMEDFDAITRIEVALKNKTSDLRDARNAWAAWKNEISGTTLELERLKAQYDGNAAAETDYMEGRAVLAEKAYEKVKGLNEEQLNSLGYTLNDQLNLEIEYYSAINELRQRDLEQQLAQSDIERGIILDKIDAIMELKDVSIDSIGSIIDTYKVLLDAYKEDGKISEREAKKKAKTLQWLEGIQGAAAVASIVADTASGWMQLNKSQAAEYVLNAETAAATGPAAAATKAALDAKTTLLHGIRKASLLVNGIAAAGAAVGKTIASIKSLAGDSGEDGGSGAGASAAPQLIDSTPYSYTRELQTDVEREEMLNTPIYVRVTDIETAQAQVRVRESEATF